MSPARPFPTGRTALLAVETATSETVVAAQAQPQGRIVADRWLSGHAHGERLLASVEGVLDRAGIELDDLAAIAVGIGPGSFTGLRIGLAAAKGLAFGLGTPIVGVATAEALARASGHAGRVVVVQPAGPSGQYRTVVERDGDGRWRSGPSEMLSGDLMTLAAPPADAATIAIDLSDVPSDVADAGRRAVDGLAEALVEAARERLASGVSDDLAELVPAYVSPPRGAIVGNGTIEWSRVRR